MCAAEAGEAPRWYQPHGFGVFLSPLLRYSSTDARALTPKEHVFMAGLLMPLRLVKMPMTWQVQRTVAYRPF